jgi:anti-sigma factor RsiW
MMSTEYSKNQRLHIAAWQDRLQDAVDAALSPAATLQVYAHLATCAICTQRHRRLLAADARLRREFAVNTEPAADFDKRLYKRIIGVAQSHHHLARKREQQEYATRLERLRNNWRELLRFHFGSFIAGTVSLGAVVTTIASTWPTAAQATTKGWISALEILWLPPGWTVALPVTATLALLGSAAAAVWITRIDRYPEQ